METPSTLAPDRRRVLKSVIGKAANIFLVRCHQRGGIAAHLPDLTEAEAYEAQAATLAGLDASVGDWKVAVVGGRPVAAPLLRSSLFASGEVLALPDDRQVMLETELGFMPGHDLPPGPIARDDLLDAIESVHTAFEVVGARGGEPPQIPFTALLADNLRNAATVVGVGKLLGELPERGRLYRDGALLVEGHHPHGDSLAGLLAYAALQSDALGELRRGQLIITGSFTGATLVRGGDYFKGGFDGLATVELTFIQRERV